MTCAGLCTLSPETGTSPHLLLDHPTQNYHLHLMAGETGSEVVAPGCDPGSDSRAWTLDHCAQLLHHRNTRRLGVDLASRRFSLTPEKRNHVRATGLLLRWQKTPLIEPKSRTIPSRILQSRGRRARLKRMCGRRRQDRLAGSNSAEHAPTTTIPHPTPTFPVNPCKSSGSVGKFSCKIGKKERAYLPTCQFCRERTRTRAELLSKAQWGGLTCNHRRTRTPSTETWQLVGHDSLSPRLSSLCYQAFKFL